MEIHASLILMKAMLIIIIVSMGFRFVFYILQSINPYDNDWYSHSKQCIHHHSQVLITRTL